MRWCWECCVCESVRTHSHLCVCVCDKVSAKLFLIFFSVLESPRKKTVDCVERARLNVMTKTIKKGQRNKWERESTQNEIKRLRDDVNKRGIVWVCILTFNTQNYFTWICRSLFPFLSYLFCLCAYSIFWFCFLRFATVLLLNLARTRINFLTHKWQKE